jgi:hypothetical protein
MPNRLLFALLYVECCFKYGEIYDLISTFELILAIENLRDRLIAQDNDIAK